MSLGQNKRRGGKLLNFIKDGLVSLGRWNVLFTILNTFILYLGLKHFLFEPVKKMMDERTAEIEEQLDSAKRTEELANETYEQYQEKMKNAKEEGMKLILEARHNAQAQYDDIVKSARKEAESVKKKSEEDILREKEKVMDGMKDEIGEMAILIAEQVIKKNIEPQIQGELIDELIQNVGDSQWQK